MNNSDNYIEYLCNKPRIGAGFYDPDYLTPEDEASKEGKVDYDKVCCHKSSDRHKYILHFERVEDDCDNHLKEERNRCRNFWEFVDSEPKLKELVKEGKHWHESCPQKLEGQIGCCVFDNKNINGRTTTTSEPCKLHIQKVRENRAALREQFEKRCAKTRELQLKSKQPLFKCKPAPKKVDLQANLFSDMTGHDLNAEFTAMNEFDNDLKNKMIEKSQKIHCAFHPWTEEQLEYPGEYLGEGYLDCQGWVYNKIQDPGKHSDVKEFYEEEDSECYEEK